MLAIVILTIPFKIACPNLQVYLKMLAPNIYLLLIAPNIYLLLILSAGTMLRI